MLSQYKRLTKHTVIYGLGTSINSLIGALLLPVYTRALTPSDYGTLEILAASSALLISLLPLGVATAAFRFTLYDNADSAEQQQRVLSTAFFFVVGIGLVILIPALFFVHGIADLLLGAPSHAPLVALMLVSVFFQLIIIIPIARLRIREESSLFATVNTLRFLVSVLLTILFVVILKKGVTGVVVAGVIAAIPFVLFFLLRTRRWLQLDFRLPILRGLLAFGAPLLVLALSTNILGVADRFFLREYAGFEQVGIYSVGYRIGKFILIPLAALQTAWPAVMFSVAKTPTARKFFSSSVTYYLFGFTFLGLALSILAKEFIEVFTTQSFFSAHTIVPFIVLAYIFNGLYFVTAVGVNLEKKTHFLVLTVGGSAILHLLLNFLLIPRYGQMGAALSTVFSFAAMAIASAIVSLRFYFIPYEYKRIAKIMMTALLIFALSLALTIDSLVLSVIFKLVLLLCFPVILFLARFFAHNELEIIKDSIHNLLLGWRQSLRRTT